MSRYVGMCSWDEVPHLTPAQREELWAAIPAHQRDARSRGIPVLGSGRVFPIPEEDITCAPFTVPKHWPRLGAIDFGWDHPTAAVGMAWDRDEDIVYVLRTHRMREGTPMMHAAVLKPWGANLPWAWPHDGLQHDKGSGEQLAQLYRKQGMKMLPERAQYENERGSGVEAGLADMLERMQAGGLKVFAGLSDWFEEFRLYHRADGRVVKLRDDLMSATRYGIMSLRFARSAQDDKPKPAQIRRPHNPGSSTGWMAR